MFGNSGKALEDDGVKKKNGSKVVPASADTNLSLNTVIFKPSKKKMEDSTPVDLLLSSVVDNAKLVEFKAKKAGKAEAEVREDLRRDVETAISAVVAVSAAGSYRTGMADLKERQRRKLERMLRRPSRPSKAVTAAFKQPLRPINGDSDNQPLENNGRLDEEIRHANSILGVEQKRPLKAGLEKPTSRRTQSEPADASLKGRESVRKKARPLLRQATASRSLSPSGAEKRAPQQGQDDPSSSLTRATNDQDQQRQG